MERITATEAARNFSKVLDRTKHQGETFLVERNGEPVAEIRPAPKRSTGADLVAFLRQPPPDPDWERDMLEIIAERKRDIARDPWGGD